MFAFRWFFFEGSFIVLGCPSFPIGVRLGRRRPEAPTLFVRPMGCAKADACMQEAQGEALGGWALTLSLTPYPDCMLLQFGTKRLRTCHGVQHEP